MRISRLFVSKWNIDNIADKNCIHCDSDTIKTTFHLKEFFRGGSVVITNVPAYQCTECKKIFGHIHAARDAQLQVVRELEHFNPQEADRLKKVVENWDHLIPERKLNAHDK